MKRVAINLPKPLIFEWDQGNQAKNWIRHGVQRHEAEEIFGNQPLINFEDVRHSTLEKRYALFGFTDEHRLLTVVYTIRGEKVRVVSARDMSKKERIEYAKY